MTILAGFQFDNGVVILADSRATWVSQLGSPLHFQDELQKLLPLDNRIAIGYAGDVQGANLIINELKRRMRRKERLRALQKLASEIPRIAKHYYKLHRSRSKSREHVALMLGGVTNSGKVLVFSYESPRFERIELKQNFRILGSGRQIQPEVIEGYKKIADQSIELQERAHVLRVLLDKQITQSSIPTIGGLFQIILLDEDGISPLQHGFINLNPYEEGESKRIKFQGGHWEQHDEGKNESYPLLNPSETHLIRPRDFKFYEFESPQGIKAEPFFQLTYFLTCKKVQLKTGVAEFDGIYSQIASSEYPMAYPNRVAIGFWGSNGTYPIEFYLDKNGNRKKIFQSSLNVKYFPEEQDFVFDFPIPVEEVGSAFLECFINGKIIGRRALYFAKIQDQIPNSPDEYKMFLEKISENLIEEHRSCSDPEIEKRGTGTLVYFQLGHNCICNQMSLRFENQFIVLYSNKYPLITRVNVASAYRFSSGQHTVRLTLMNAATRKEYPFDTASVEGSSSCIVSPILGDLLLRIPEPGIYFVKNFIDDEFVGAGLFVAETDNPMYSYSLADEQIKKIKSGEIYCLLKRSKQID